MALPFVLIVAALLIAVFGELSKSTEELFCENLSDVEGIQSYTSKWSIKYLPLWVLQKKSMASGGSLIVSAINVSESVEFYNEIALLELIDILISKGESIGLLKGEPCYFFDQLIMKGDFGLVEYMLSRGASVPNGSDGTCSPAMSNVLRDYKYKYSEAEYLELLKILEYDAK